MDTIVNIRLPDGTELTLGDWVDKPVFSAVMFLTGFTDPVLEAFGYNVGEPVPATSNATVKITSTEADTNIAAAGGNVSTEELLIYAIKPEYFELQTTGTVTDLTTAAPRLPGQPVMRPTTLGKINLALMLRLRVSEKVYADAGSAYFNTGFGVFGMGQLLSQAAAGTARTYANAGWPAQDAVRSFAVPQHIGGTEKYTVQWLNWPGNTINFTDEGQAIITGLTVYARTYLDGMRKRPTA
jgi:hypothetical protein